MPGRVQDRVIIVTGGAQGIGAGIARGLATNGGKVVVADLNADRAADTAEAIRESGGTAIPVGVDVSDRASVKTLIDRTVEEFGELNVIFNNAGISKPEAFLEITEDSWNRIMKVNGLGVFIAMQEAARQFISQGSGGKIINTGSIASRQGMPDFSHYCASKAAVLSMTQAGAREWATHRITVNGFAPGVVETPLWEDLDKQFAARDHKQQGESIAEASQGILLGRAATPEDITPTALFLASSDSDYMTGQMVMIDGGMILV
jgi:meso-butanediol dehydrogenase/(S,S)-butanediol dehydrogenase/diacetyl reductase